MLAAELARRPDRAAAIAALIDAANGDADALHAAREPFLARLHSDAADVDASLAMIVLERAAAAA